MPNTTRRRSRTLRLTLAAVALLGIGAAVTAAAWQDAVYVDVDLATGSMDLEGKVTTDGQSDGWKQSDAEDNIELAIDLRELTPGDSHDVLVEFRNNGSMTAYVTLDALPGLILQDLNGCLGDDVVTGGIDASFEVAGGDDIQFPIEIDVPDDWPNTCQDQTFISGTLVFNATTDAP